MQTRPPPGVDPAAIDPGPILSALAGRSFEREILVANPRFTHLLLAERYQTVACSWQAMRRTSISRPAVTA